MIPYIEWKELRSKLFTIHGLIYRNQANNEELHKAAEALWNLINKQDTEHEL